MALLCCRRQHSNKSGQACAGMLVHEQQRGRFLMGTHAHKAIHGALPSAVVPSGFLRVPVALIWSMARLSFSSWRRGQR
jgi:hypothetical protein